MTEQSHKPTPGPYHIELIRRRQGWEIRGPKNEVIAEGPIWEPEHSEELWATAELLRASWETAAKRDRLVEALDGLILVCCRTGESLKDFEEQAAAFQWETGKMRPGKDVPMGAADLGATPKEYRDWVDGKVTEARTVLSEAGKPPVHRPVRRSPQGVGGSLKGEGG